MNLINQSPATIHQALVSLVSHHITDHREDLMTCDLHTLTNKGSAPFIHLTRAAGTHMYFFPEYPGHNHPIPYLFGTATPRSIYQQQVDMIADYPYPGRVIFTHYDGRQTLRIVNRVRAATLFADALSTIVWYPGTRAV